jgi:hypothetical protein
MSTDPDEVERMVYGPNGPAPGNYGPYIRLPQFASIDDTGKVRDVYVDSAGVPRERWLNPDLARKVTHDTWDRLTGVRDEQIKAENDWITAQFRARRTPWQRFMDRFDDMASFEAAMLPLLLVLWAELWVLLPLGVFCLLVVVSSPTILRAFQQARRGWKA